MSQEARRRWRWGGFIMLAWPIPTLVYVLTKFDLARYLYGDTSGPSAWLALMSCCAIPLLVAGAVIWPIAWRERQASPAHRGRLSMFYRARPILRWGLAAVFASLGVLFLHQAMYFAWLTATPVGPTPSVISKFAVSLALAVACFPATAYAIYYLRPRGFPPHRCQKCGYDLTGAPSAKCPECGESN